MDQINSHDYSHEMIIKTTSGEPLSETALANLARLRAMAQAEQTLRETAESEVARMRRAGVRAYTEEEKQAFLAMRPDLLMREKSSNSATNGGAK